MKRSLAIAAALTAIVAGCSPHASESARAARVPRVISFAPSLTEIAYAIGCGDRLVADTAYDDYPVQARALPHVADTRTADLEHVAALRPTAVVALHDQEAEGSPVERQLGIPVSYLPNRDLSDLSADIEGVGRACGMTAQAATLSRTLSRQIAELSKTTSQAARPRVLYLLGLPGFAAGGHSFLSDMIEAAGGDNVAAGTREPYPDLNAEAIVHFDPDVIIVARDTPFGADIRATEPWRSLRAVRDGRVLQPPSDDIMERNGPRVVNGLRWLRAALKT